MAKSQKKSSIFSKIKDRIADSHEANKGKAPKQLFVDIPAGITGVAEVRECRLGEFDKGEFKGEPFFYAAAIIVSPEFATDKNGQQVKIKGQRTSIMIRLADDKKPNKEGVKKTLDDDFYPQMLDAPKRLVGEEQVNDTDANDIEDLMAEIEKAGIYTGFRTWSGKPSKQYPDPRVNHQWTGAVEYTPSEDDEEGGEVDDESGDEDEADDEDDTETEEEESPKKKSKPAAKAPAKKSSKADEDDEESEEDEAEDESEEQEEAKPKGMAGKTNEQLAKLADKGDKFAKRELTKRARAADLNEEDYDTWKECAEAITDAAIEDDEEPEEAADEEESDDDESEESEDDEEEFVPEKGDVYHYHPIVNGKKSKKPVEVEVTAVFPSKKKATVKNMDTDKLVKDVSFDDLSPPE